MFPQKEKKKEKKKKGKKEKKEKKEEDALTMRWEVCHYTPVLNISVVCFHCLLCLLREHGGEQEIHACTRSEICFFFY